MPMGLIPLTVRPGAQSIPAAGGTSLTFDIPNDAPIATFGLRLAGNILVGTAAASALQSGGIANAISRVRILSKGETRLELPGRFFKILHQIHQQGSIVVTEPGLTVATQPFEIVIERAFQMARMLQPWADQGILPNHLLRDVQVVVDLGTPSDVLAKAATTTLAFSGATCECFVEQATPFSVNPDFYVNEQVISSSDTALLTATGARDFKLNVGGLFRHLICISESIATPGGGADTIRSFNDTLVTNLQLISSRTEVANLSWIGLQGQNRRRFLLTSTLAGVSVLDWTANFSPNELWNGNEPQNNGQSLTLRATVGISAANSIFTVIPVRVFGNFAQLG